MSSLLRSSRCLRAFLPYSDENNPWEYDGAVRVGKGHEFVRLGDVDEERNFHYTPEFKRPLADPVLHPDANRFIQLQWDKGRKVYLKSVGVDDWRSHMNRYDGGYDGDLDREDEEIEVFEQTYTIIDNYIKDDDEEEKYSVHFDKHDLLPQIPQVEIHVEELEDGDECDGDVILKVSIDDEARRVAIETLSVSNSECLCRLDGTFYVDIAQMQKELDFESLENGLSWVGCLKMCSPHQERLWSRIMRCEPACLSAARHSARREH
ncbi:hypothetical protein ACMFMG_008264 [Clarireedia jacksonii]